MAVDPWLLRQLVEQQCTIIVSNSGGPGGQNVNKVNSRVQLYLPLAVLRLFSPQELALVRQVLANRITADDQLLISCDTHRSQLKNRRTAVDRAVNLLLSASKPPKKRTATKPSKGALLRRKEKRQRQSQKKAQRRWDP